MLFKRLKHLEETAKIQCIGRGFSADAFALPNGRVLKVMEDSGQVDFLRIFGNSTNHFPRYYHLKQIESVQVVVMERLVPIQERMLNYRSFVGTLSLDINKVRYDTDYSTFLGNKAKQFKTDLVRLIIETEERQINPDITPKNIMFRDSDNSIVFLDPWA